ncbi:MAG: hypothetical protein IT289_01925 [Oligoflexia bacterium]|nr:hypothetical protein [Oligoflexia bacterium]
MKLTLKTFLMILVFAGSGAGLAQSTTSKNLSNTRPLKDIFDHKRHSESFKKMSISCTDCHTFSVKAVTGDPTAKGVPAGYLKPQSQVCHQCHMAKITVPRPNQCTLCHTNVGALMPKSHGAGWKSRHGRFAQTDPDSCKECHSENSCTKCHSQRDAARPNVHRPSFRFSHSVEARSNPQSCVVCHSNTATCTQCHTKGLK